MGDMMFDEDKAENGMRAAVEFLNADTNIRNGLINNLMQSGEESLEGIGRELSNLMRKQGIDINPKHLAKALSETYEFGVHRYIGEYDNSSLSERDIFNENVEVDERGIDNAMHRKRRINNMVDDLDCRDQHVPSCWSDFVSRGYSEVRRTIYEELGDKAVRDFEYYFNYDTRDILKYGLTSGLTSVYDRSVEDLQHLSAATSKLEEQVVESKRSSNTISSNAAMFK